MKRPALARLLQVRGAKGVVVVTSAFAIVIGGSMASCGPKDKVCDDGEMCVWRSDEHTNLIYDFELHNEDSNYTNGSPKYSKSNTTMNDSISSYWNRADSSVVFYENSNFGGECFAAMTGSSEDDLSDWNGVGTWNPEDSFSAHTSDPGVSRVFCFQDWG